MELRLASVLSTHVEVLVETGRGHRHCWMEVAVIVQCLGSLPSSLGKLSMGCLPSSLPWKRLELESSLSSSSSGKAGLGRHCHTTHLNMPRLASETPLIRCAMVERVSGGLMKLENLCCNGESLWMLHCNRRALSTSEPLSAEMQQTYQIE